MDEHLKKIQSDVDAMNKTFEQGEVKTDPPSTDPPEVKTDPPSTDPPFEVATDEPKTDPPTTDEPKTEPPTTDAPDDRDKVIEDLRRELDERSAKTDPPKTDAPTTDAPVELKDFVGDLDAEDMNPEELNKLLNKTYKQAVEDVRAQGGDVTQALPEYVATVMGMQKAVDGFYGEHDDLIPYKKEVAREFEKVRLASPDKLYGDLMADTALQVRENLKLPKPSNKKVDRGNPPRLPKKKSVPGKKKDEPKLDPMSKDIDDMNKSLRR